MKKLLSIALLSTISFSANLVMPYFSYIDYSNKSIKDEAYNGGIYFSYFKMPYKLEADVETLNISYKDNTPDYNENDVTLVGNYFFNNFKVKLGIRNMFIDQDNNNDSYDKVLFGGVLYYKYLDYNMGVDYYYSDYDDFHVNQITPHFGVYCGDYNSYMGSFYMSLDLNFIHLSKEAITNKDRYLNADLSITNYQGPFSTTIRASVGKNAYKVANGGFVVYNLKEEYKNSIGLDVVYSLNKDTSLKVSYTRNNVKENNQNVFSNVFVGSLIYNF